MSLSEGKELRLEFFAFFVGFFMLLLTCSNGWERLQRDENACFGTDLSIATSLPTKRKGEEKPFGSLPRYRYRYRLHHGQAKLEGSCYLASIIVKRSVNLDENGSLDCDAHNLAPCFSRMGLTPNEDKRAGLLIVPQRSEKSVRREASKKNEEICGYHCFPLTSDRFCQRMG